MSNEINENMPPKKECAFCGRNHLDVKGLIASPDGGTYICEDCVKVCNDIFDTTKRQNVSEKIDLPTPSKLKEFLDEYVIGQDQAKRALAVCKCSFHQNQNSAGRTSSQ